MHEPTNKASAGILREWQKRPLGDIICDWFRGTGQKTIEPQPTEPVTDDAAPVCHRCFREQKPGAMFCPECGTAVGPYNNLMPLERIASLGEVARSGVGPEARFTPMRLVGYILLGLTQYMIFAPLYFYRLYRNYRRMNPEPSARSTQQTLTQPNLPKDMPYQERVKQYSLETLVDVKHHIDKEKYPDRYDLILQEIAKRKAIQQKAREASQP